ncbi:hypothetical protein [Streptomyces sp. NBC_00887]|nr:hypothetical protein OG844_13725 [Streptomyces sp. NBC_00887]
MHHPQLPEVTGVLGPENAAGVQEERERDGRGAGDSGSRPPAT